MKIQLDIAWAERTKLRAEGDKLRAEGNKLHAEGNKLRAEGDKLYAEGSLVFINKVIELCGPDATMERTDTGCIVQGIMEFYI